MLTETILNINTVKLKWQLACDEVYPYFASDHENEDVIKLLLLYIARDERFETAVEDKNYSLGKGILLQGRPGTGKTVLMRIVQRTLYYLRSELQFKRLNMREICQDYQASGPGVLMPERRHWFVDEFGLTDREYTLNYGNRIVVGDELAGIRYDLFQQGYMTHLTTNLSDEEIVGFYNDRTFSRLQEMCNFIPLDGTDRRPYAKPLPVKRETQRQVDRKKIYRDWWQMILRQFHAYKKTGHLEIKGPLQQFQIFEDAGLIIMDAATKEQFIVIAQQQIKQTPLPFDRTEAIALKALIAGIESDSLTVAQDGKIKALAATLAIQSFYNGKVVEGFGKVVEGILEV